MVQRFHKYHAIGNDFIVIDRLKGGAVLDSATVRWLCNRHRGVGADGVLTVWPEPGCAARMQVQNADGSESAMCGNGLRCVARYLADAGMLASDASEVTLAAGTGLYGCTRVGDDRFRVDMGRPDRSHPDLPRSRAADGAVELAADGRRFVGTAVFLGNPHYVLFVEPGEEPPLQLAHRYGAKLEHDPAFPNRANISFVRPLQAGGYEAVVHERGVGVTQACGSGACAVAVAAVRQGLSLAEQPIEVRLPGGSLRIWVGPDESLTMEGEAVAAFSGEVQLPP